MLGRRMSEVARRHGRYVWEGKVVLKSGLIRKAMVWEYPNGEREVEVKDETMWDHGYYPLSDFEVAEYRPPLPSREER